MAPKPTGECGQAESGAYPFFVTNYSAFRAHQIFTIDGSQLSEYRDDWFMLESNYVSLPQSKDVLVVVERFEKTAVWIWCAAYRRMPDSGYLDYHSVDGLAHNEYYGWN